MEPLRPEHNVSSGYSLKVGALGDIDITTCEECGCAVKVIASIEDPAVIKQILAQLEKKAESKEFYPLPESRAPPQGSLFG